VLEELVAWAWHRIKLRQCARKIGQRTAHSKHNTEVDDEPVQNSHLKEIIDV